MKAIYFIPILLLLLIGVSSSNMTFTVETLPTSCAWCNETYTNFTDSNWSFIVAAPLVMSIYTHVWPGLSLWGALWLMVFGMFWIRQEDVTIPAICYIILAMTINQYIPLEWQFFMYASILVVIVGWIYVLFRKQ